MEEKPFESLVRGLDKDLSSLLETQEPDLYKSKRPTRLGSVFGVPSLPIGTTHSTEKSFKQQPFESLSDRFAHEIAIFPLTNHVVIRKFGAFIPQSIFGTETELAYKEERDETGAVKITVHSKHLVPHTVIRLEFEGARVDLDEPIRTDDAIFNLGRNPISCGISDASENLDKYLYGGE